MVNEWKKRWNSHKGHETVIWYFVGYLHSKIIEENWAKIQENWAYLIIPWIFSRIGLPKSLLKHDLYEEIIEKLNKEGDPLNILHPVAFVHCYKKNQLEKQAQDAKVTKPMMSGRSEMQRRRKLMGLPPLKGPISLDIYEE